MLAYIYDRVCKENTMYYVIQVKTGKEQKAIEDIMKNKPDDASFDVFAPYRKTIRKFHGVEKEVIERCFPGYIFVETDDSYIHRALVTTTQNLFIYIRQFPKE